MNKDLIHELRTSQYITVPHNVIIVGPTGSGKRYIARALGYEACLGGMHTEYVWLPDKLTEIALSKAEVTFSKLLKRYERFYLIIIDEWVLMSISRGWHERLGGGAVADAVLDHLVSRSKKIEIQGERSMRKRIN